MYLLLLAFLDIANKNHFLGVPRFLGYEGKEAYNIFFRMGEEAYGRIFSCARVVQWEGSKRVQTQFFQCVIYIDIMLSLVIQCCAVQTGAL